MHAVEDKLIPFDVFLPSHRDRLSRYRTLTVQMASKGVAGSKDSFAFDLDYELFARPRISNHDQCMIGDGAICLDDLERQLCSAECCSLNGCPVLILN